MSVMSRYGLGRRDARQRDLPQGASREELHGCDNLGSASFVGDEELGLGIPASHRRAMSHPPGEPTKLFAGTGGLAALQSGCAQRPLGIVPSASCLGDPERRDADVRRVVEVVGHSRSELFGDFYRDLMYELGEHAQRGGTAYGAAAVLKRVALAYGLAVAEHTPWCGQRVLSAKRCWTRHGWRRPAGRTRQRPAGRTPRSPGTGTIRRRR